jgi:hypothetical protein
MLEQHFSSLHSVSFSDVQPHAVSGEASRSEVSIALPDAGGDATASTYAQLSHDELQVCGPTDRLPD